MKIRTLSQLDDLLDENISWRKKELTAAMYDYAVANEKKQDYYLRVLIVTLYSHWEGFIKQSTEYYLEYISNLGLTLNILKPNFIALSLDNYINNLSNINSINIKQDIITFLVNDLAQKKYQFKKGQVNTQSNLNLEVLKKICLVAGINDILLDIDIVWIDERLLKNRNAIAHGEKLIKKDIEFELLELKEKVQNALDIYKSLISNAASLKSYLKEIGE